MGKDTPTNTDITRMPKTNVESL